MDVTFSTVDQRAVISLRGRFDFNSHREFREAIDQALAQTNVTAIQVDLGGVDYLDSSALGMLLMLRDRAKAAARQVSLANSRGAVKQVLDIANFNKLFAIT